MVHGIIGDGASTNKKMWKVLGIVSNINGLKTHFVYPMDDDRKVFIFSDTPYLIKCIRNRLYNKGRLKVNPDDNYIKWDYFNHLYNKDTSLPGNCRVCPKISKRHVQLDNTTKMRVRFATQIFSNSVSVGLHFYLAHNLKEFHGCETTADFCVRINNVFDTLNRKQANEDLTLESKDFKILKEATTWLNAWENNVLSNQISENEFLTMETAHGLRTMMTSTLDLCTYLIDKFQFKYLLSGKVNQDNLEKFFGTIRIAAGSNEHPTCPNFLLLYKLLSVYSIIKPPKYENCTVTEKKLESIISISNIKQIYKKTEADSSQPNLLKRKLDNIIICDDCEVHKVFEHDYSEAPVLECVIYYVTGF